MKKLFALLIVVVVAVAVVVYIRKDSNDSNTPQNSVDLAQTYNNSKDSYSFKYPAGYELRGLNEFGSDVEISNNSNSVIVRKTGSSDVFFGISHSSLTTLNEDGIKSQYGATDPKNIVITSTQIAGKSVAKVQINNDPQVISDFYYVQIDSQTIMNVTVVKNNSESLAIFNSLSFNK